MKLSSRSPAKRFGRREVVFAEMNDGTRLRTLGTLGVLRNKTDFIAHRKLVKPAVCDAVAVEVDLITVGADDEAAILLGKETRDPPVVGHRVHLDIPASLANVLFEQPAGRVEGVADRDIDVLVRMVRRGIAADDDLAPGDLQVDAYPEQIALLVARVPTFDDDAT